MVEKVKIVRNDAVQLLDATAISTNGVDIDFNGRDDKTLVLVTSTASSVVKLTVAKGTGIQAVGDAEISVPAGKTVGIVLESMKFKNLSKGTVNIKASATGTAVQVVEL